VISHHPREVPHKISKNTVCIDALYDNLPSVEQCLDRRFSMICDNPDNEDISLTIFMLVALRLIEEDG
jgi:hypothetical protein